MFLRDSIAFEDLGYSEIDTTKIAKAIKSVKKINKLKLNKPTNLDTEEIQNH